ncbi:low-specificity L-threonine aldolase [Fredinandcohnia sp. QZ13]|uniref:low-specificity L-threonine aldolase n=1 Tax=Fredinandcohnia sp. QZ13 TaxID=3073144 RepID=UPI002853234A|nr:low-specificity L-threonine aldolase [Fredinandcohnia sp. QZ13]MDR4889326.1 low-specificity L-threonine aldolase [Fredinandcohnia sp. QZ13]
MIDLRSDTVTKPTAEMRKAAYEAEVGDDVYQEDPTVKELEQTAAEMLGKEAAMFVTSGTQGNQIAVLTHTRRGNEIIVEQESHIFNYEGAAISAFAGVQPRTIKGNRGAMDPVEVEAAIQAEDVHNPETGLICIENTHNRAGGAVIPLGNMDAIYKVASANHIPVHLDGARLFNAAVALGCPVKDIAQYTDSVQFCLSKGLGAPVGSIIAGSEDFINQARKWRKRLGGGLRQVGIIAAPGLVALRTMVERLAIDHENASFLAQGLSNISGMNVVNQVDTNIILVEVSERELTSSQFAALLKDHGVLVSTFGPKLVRFTTHYDVNRESIEKALQIVSKL